MSTRIEDRVLLDTELALWLLAKSRRSLLKLLLSQTEAYLSALSLYRIASAMNVVGLGSPQKLFGLFEKIFHIVYPDRDILSTAAKINADLLQKGEKREEHEVILASSAIKTRASLLTMSPKVYDVYKVYGLSVQEFDKAVEKYKMSLRRKIPSIA